MRIVLCILILLILFISCEDKSTIQNGMRRVESTFSNKYGFRDSSNGKLIVPKEYDWASDFESDYAIVEKNKKRGVIDKRGKIIIPLEYDNVQYIPQGLLKQNSPLKVCSDYFKIRVHGNEGVINYENKEIIPTVTNSILSYLPNGYFEVKMTKDENSICLFDKLGNKLTDAIFSRVVDIKNNYAILKKGYSHKIVDLKNNTSKINSFSLMTSIELISSYDSTNNIFIKAYRNNGYIIFDSIGNILIPLDYYSSINGFNEGYFTVYVENIGYGYSDINGNLIIKPVFSEIEPFENGIAKVKFKEKIFYIDKQGNCVKDCPSDKWLDFHKISNFKMDLIKYQDLVKLGLKEAKEQKHDESMKTFSDAIYENPVDYEAYYNRGLSYLIINELDKAKKDIESAIKYSPNNSDSYYVLGCILQKQETYYKAISAFEKSIKLNPLNAEAYMRCAIIYNKQNNNDKACKYLKKACELSNRDACFVYNKFCK